MVDAPDQNPVHRIGAADFVSVDEIDVASKRVPEDAISDGIVLRIAVGIEDQVTRGCGESASECRAIAAISRVMDDSHLWVRARELVNNLRGRVGAAVVDDNDLEIRR